MPAADDLRRALARAAAPPRSATNVEAEIHRLANEGLQRAHGVSRSGDAAHAGGSLRRGAARPELPDIDDERNGDAPGGADRSGGARGRSGAHAARTGVRAASDQPPAPGAPRSEAHAERRVTRASPRSQSPGRRGAAYRGRSRTGGTRHARGLDGRGDAAGHYRAARCRVLAAARGDARSRSPRSADS